MVKKISIDSVISKLKLLQREAKVRGKLSEALEYQYHIDKFNFKRRMMKRDSHRNVTFVDFKARTLIR